MNTLSKSQPCENTKNPVNLLVDDDRCALLKKLTSSMQDIILNDRHICDFELLVTGVYTPLTGFMKQIDYESVLDPMRFGTGKPYFKQRGMNPSKVRNIFARLGWKRIVGFQTRQPIHRPQFEMTLKAMEKARVNLLHEIT